MTVDLHPNRIPDCEHAALDDAKLVEYLLNSQHSTEAAAKARFFALLGFTRGNWRELRDLILTRVPTVPGVLEGEGQHGEAWTAIVPLVGAGRRARLLTVWERRPGEPPRLVTAYPADD